MNFLNDLTPTDIALLLDVVDSSSLSSETEDAWSNQTPEPKPGPGPSYRHRKRQELVRLRREVETLEQEVRNLQRERRNEDGVITLVPAISSVWRRMAEHQRQARKHSELENARLRKACERQQKSAQQFQSFLERQVAKQPTELVHPDDLAYAAFDVRSGIEDGTVYTAFTEVDAVLHEVGLSEITSDFEDICLNNGTDGLPYLQVRQARVFPFDRATVEQSATQPQAAVPFIGSSYSIKVWTNEHIVVQYETPAYVGRVEVTVTGELTVHMKNEPSRKVNRFTQTYFVRSDHKAYDGIRMKGEGWYTTQNLDDAATSSIVHCVERTTLHGIQKHDLSLLSRVISDQYSAHFNRVESTLMDHVIRCRTVQCG